jgi:hypothetical protein
MVKRRPPVAVDWSYVAGYFDGEGNVSCGKQTKVSFFNTHKLSLLEIQKRLSAGRIYERRNSKSSLGRKRMYVLTVCRGEDLRRILPRLIKGSVIKKSELEKLLRVVLTRRFRTTPYEWWKSIDIRLFAARYHSRNGSIAVLAKQYGVSQTAIFKLLVRKGITRKAVTFRRSNFALLPFQRLKISKARKEFWSNPANRYRMSIAMKSGWKKSLAAKEVA